jgi:hypothetical protein
LKDHQLANGNGQSFMSETDPTSAAQPAATGHCERRAYVRVASDLAATCNAAGGAREVGWPARVRDISAGGVGLLLQHCFRTGTTLMVELRDSTGKLLRTVVVRVVHTTAVLVDGSPCWLVGCCFDGRLSEEEFAALQ